MTTATESFEEFLARAARRVDRVLARRLLRSRRPRRLLEAMRYAVFGGGKRFRPALVYMGCRAFGGHERDVDGAAAAVEMVHVYSMIHDDLPCMDDDDLRRGRPTLHVKFDEAMAVLAGDALQTEAFETIVDLSRPELARDLVRTLARAAGTRGMVGGQVEDLDAEGREPDERVARRIHLGKTAALIAASLEMGAIGARASATRRRKIRDYGLLVGLAFQVADDVLDVVGDAAALGKTPGKDAAAGKSTYPAAIGVEKAQALARALAARARRRAGEIGGESRRVLEALPGFVVDRSH